MKKPRYYVLRGWDDKGKIYALPGFPSLAKARATMEIAMRSENPFFVRLEIVGDNGELFYRATPKRMPCHVCGKQISLQDMDTMRVGGKRVFVHYGCKTKKNPATVAEMRAAYEGFHWGTPSRGGYPAKVPGNGFEIGKLTAVGTPAGDHILRGKKPRLVVDSRGKLHILGKLQGVAPGSHDFRTIAYSTYKRGAGRHVWQHQFGEEGGRRPKLVVKGGRAKVVGGSYTVEDRGIVD